MTEAVPPTIATLLRDWHGAVNTKDLPRVLRLCTEDITVTGPQGTGSGHDLVSDWLTGSGIRLKLLSLTTWGDGVLAEQQASWPAGGGPAGAGPAEPVPCVTVFHARDGRICSLARYETVEQARAALG
jgi:hypothetical protein